MHLIDLIKEEAESALRRPSAKPLSTSISRPRSFNPEDFINGDLSFPCFQLAKSLKTAPPKIAADLAGQAWPSCHLH